MHKQHFKHIFSKEIELPKPKLVLSVYVRLIWSYFFESILFSALSGIHCRGNEASIDECAHDPTNYCPQTGPEGLWTFYVLNRAKNPTHFQN